MFHEYTSFFPNTNQFNVNLLFDNKGSVSNSSIHEYTLVNKHHSEISYHVFREDIVACVLRLGKLYGTKTLGVIFIKSLIDQIHWYLYWYFMW